MGHYLLLAVSALTAAAVVFGVTVLVSGSDPGLTPSEPDGQAVPLPGTRPLVEADISGVRFDTALRGYRMAQVDQAIRRAAYDIGYKDELISVLEAEVAALRDGRVSDAEVLRRAREAAIAPTPAPTGEPSAPEADVAEADVAEAAAAPAAVVADEDDALSAVDEPALPAADVAETPTSVADEAPAEPSEPADQATDDQRAPTAEPATAETPAEPAAAAEPAAPAEPGAAAEPAAPAEPEPEPEAAVEAGPGAAAEPDAGVEAPGTQSAAEASASAMNTPAERA